MHIFLYFSNDVRRWRDSIVAQYRLIRDVYSSVYLPQYSDTLNKGTIYHSAGAG